MSLKKLSEPYRYPHSCKSPDHNPPTMIVLDPGVYEWTCPDCGQKQIFTIQVKGEW